MGWEIAFGIVFLMAAWHGIKYGVPRTMRAVGNRRRTSIDRWRAKHPKAPASARWAAGAAHGVAALRWGPGYFKREFKQAFQDAWDAGKQKYKTDPVEDPTDPTGVKNCADCKGNGVKGGKPCPSCVERQRQRNEEWERNNPPRPTSPAPPPTGRPNLRSVPPPAPTSTPPAQPQRSKPMPTATTIEVTSPETLKAFLEAKVQAAAAELEDARADAARAEAAVAEIERTAAALTSLELPASDIAQVKALLEPDMRWLAAAQARVAAADQRLAGAKAALTMAARHVQLQANGAAGRFYGNRAS